VALRVGPLPELTLDELVSQARARAGTEARWIALDGVEDPQNVGALARVAESAGVDGLILTDRRAPIRGGTVSRASGGALGGLAGARVSNQGRARSALQAGLFRCLLALRTILQLLRMIST
jgi:23S rRNA (guanosine2251-2'-O)-methyltransferase